MSVGSRYPDGNATSRHGPVFLLIEADQAKYPPQTTTVSPMSSHRTTAAWIACCAVLFGLLVMPLSPMPANAQGEPLLWGSFCTGSGTQWVAIALGDVEQPQPNKDAHGAMLHCGCCSGHVVVIMPAGLNRGLFGRIEPEQFPPPHVFFHSSPRQHWPSVNPRASPNA